MKHSLKSLLAVIFIATTGVGLTEAICPCAVPTETKKDDKTSPVTRQQFEEICKGIELQDVTLEMLQNSDECQKMALLIAKTFATNLLEHQAETKEDIIPEDVSTKLLMKSIEQLSEGNEIEMLKKGFALFVMYPEEMMQNPEVAECIRQVNEKCNPA